MTKVLVAYVSPLDATATIAMTVAEQLCRHGYPVELRPICRARAFSAYRAVVLGGAVSDDRWDDEALGYVERSDISCRTPIWMFHTRFETHPARLPCGPPDIVRLVADRLETGPVPTFGRTVPSGRGASVPAGWVGLDDDHEQQAVREWATAIALRLELSTAERAGVPRGGVLVAG